MESEKRLKVIFFPAWYPQRNDSMTGIFVKYHAQAVNLYADVAVVFVIGEERHSGPAIEANYQVEEGIPTLRMYYKNNGSKSFSLFNAWNYFYAAIKGYSLLVQKTGKPDIHHVHVLTRAGFWPWLMKITGNIPYIITEHWSRYTPQNSSSYQGAFRKWFTKKVVKQAAFVCPVNQNLAKAMQSHGLENPNYQPVFNVVDTERFVPKTPSGTRNRFVHISWVEDRPKNIFALIRSFAAALEENVDISLTVVGDGPDLEASKTLVNELNVSDKITFTGLLEGDALVEAYHRHDCLLMFSRYENQPVVIIEAFACGIPVIATDVGGIAELLAEKRGILVESGDEKGLKEAILDFYKGADLASPEELRQYILEQHAYAAVGKQFHDLYLAALKRSI